MRLKLARAIAFFSLLAVPAFAQGAKSTKLECIEAHKQAQIDERDGKLLAAREAWAKCAAEACPKLVRKSCTEGLASIGSKVPSVTVIVREKGGRALPDAKVELDGEPLDEQARSRPFELDPGEHVLTAELPDGRRAERRFTLAPGEQSMPVVAEIAAPAPEPVAVPDAPAERPVPPVVYVLGGVAGLGLITFVGFGLAGKSTEGCKPNCTSDERDTLRSQYLIADVGLAVAVLAGGAATYFYLSRPEAGRERAFVSVRPLLGGAGLSIGSEL